MSDLKILVPRDSLNSIDEQTDLLEVFKLSPFKPYSKLVLSFIQHLSEELLKNPQCKQQPELVALGFWLRQSNIKRLIKHQERGIFLKALGTVLHFTPANIDSMFVYSWVCALLMGNNNIIRVASAESETKTLLLEQINKVMTRDEFQPLALRNRFVSYAKQSELTQILSLKALGRVMWGGDASVQSIRNVASHPRCRDISFADKYSACLINGDALQTDEHIADLATKLWRDTQPHEQQACSSPRLIFWLGSNVKQKALFEKINQLATRKHTSLGQSNNHLVLSQLMQSTGLAGQAIIQENICVLPITKFLEQHFDWHQGAGAYFVLDLGNRTDSVENLTDLMAGIVTDKLQTLSVWQVEKSELLKLIENPSTQGIDRIVPVGQALDFSPTWDGYDVLMQLSRNVVINV